MDISPKGHFTEWKFHRKDILPNQFLRIVHFAEIRFPEVISPKSVSPNGHFAEINGHFTKNVSD
jgi:hypothetical protein